jgi:hypothetical protein
MGHLKVTRMFLNTALHTFDYKYFLRDQKYWGEPPAAESVPGPNPALDPLDGPSRLQHEVN